MPSYVRWDYPIVWSFLSWDFCSLQSKSSWQTQVAWMLEGLSTGRCNLMDFLCHLSIDSIPTTQEWKNRCPPTWCNALSQLTCLCQNPVLQAIICRLFDTSPHDMATRRFDMLVILLCKYDKAYRVEPHSKCGLVSSGTMRMLCSRYMIQLHVMEAKWVSVMVIGSSPGLSPGSAHPPQANLLIVLSLSFPSD